MCRIQFCKEAQQEGDKTCWGRGENEHLETISTVGSSVSDDHRARGRVIRGGVIKPKAR